MTLKFLNKNENQIIQKVRELKLTADTFTQVLNAPALTRSNVQVYLNSLPETELAEVLYNLKRVRFSPDQESEDAPVIEA